MVKLKDLLKEEKLAEMKVNKSKVMKAYTGVLNHMRKEIRKLNDDEMYEMTTKLKQWFNKNIHVYALFNKEYVGGSKLLSKDYLQSSVDEKYKVGIGIKL